MDLSFDSRDLKHVHTRRHICDSFSVVRLDPRSMAQHLVERNDNRVRIQLPMTRPRAVIYSYPNYAILTHCSSECPARRGKGLGKGK